MNALTRITGTADPAMIALAEALARAHVKRDIAALRAARTQPALCGPNGENHADGHLRSL